VRIKISQLLLRELADPRLAGIHVTRVEMSPDLSLARVFYRPTPGGASLEEAGRALRGAVGYLRRELGRTLRLRVTPELRLEVDALVDDGDRVEILLADLAAKRAPAGTARPVHDDDE
jgi:ribosome-binding factor A